MDLPEIKAEICGSHESRTASGLIMDPATQSVLEWVLWQANARPNACAVKSSRGDLSYRELDQRSAVLAQRLKALGVGPEVVVGLCLGRSRAMVVGALGILRAGGAYLPIDPSDPEKRLAALLQDANVQVLLTGAEAKLNSLANGRRLVMLEDCGEIIDSAATRTLWPIDNLDAVGDAEVDADRNVRALSSRLAYVIYTSGSTGQPKGVEITHGNLSNLVAWHLEAFNVTAADRATQLARVGFDAAVWEIWPYLSAGASIHLPSDELLNDPPALRDWLAGEAITISFVPTPLAERLLSLEWPRNISLRTMLTGGDALHRYPPPGLPFSLINNYGPTECTVVATSALVAPDKSGKRLPPMGKAISNTRTYILDDCKRPVAAGNPGELYIGGAGVGRGYRSRPDLTAERFIENPFGKAKGDRLFKTGDLVQSLPDGQIAFLGRVDEQVKVRGFRIEPHEIVAALDLHPAISQSAVVPQEVSAGEQRLIAYIVPKKDVELTLSELRDFLGMRLPDYMVPALFVKLTALPLTANGKVDRSALPSPERAETLRDESFTAPDTETERAVAAMLAPLLGISEVDVNANFFSLGGHSLLGTQLIARLRDAFGVELPLRVIFEAPTVLELSAEVERLLLARLEAMSEEEARRLLDSTESACVL